ncbi:hypothetical protein ACFQ3S_05870 [Mucilaginibacter terrae]|uniref:hypothetical protein n=1 Tax=Mucilaginibacter terrae TaxID=1955052 RepID=UPI00363FDB22
MKKILLACVFVTACTGIVKAQDLSPRYYLPLTLNSINSSTLKVDTSVNALLGKKADRNPQIKDLLKSKLAPVSTQFDEVYYSTMPVVANNIKLTDMMPIIKPGERNMRYTMTIKRIEIVDPTKVKAEHQTDVER